MGSVACALLHAGVGAHVVHALGLALPTGHVVMAQLVASGVPHVGGRWTPRSALALMAAGAVGRTAVSAVLGCRLLTGARIETPVGLTTSERAGSRMFSRPVSAIAAKNANSGRAGQLGRRGGRRAR
ncbi:hypothetical protein [Streptomyces griseoluteus]|uniref:hypothetical protein n=1 Tax=Streptomyces griseoluteus TaxID=29306 RepID=UPI0036FE7BDD